MTTSVNCQEACRLVVLPPNTPPSFSFKSRLTNGCTLRVLQEDTGAGNAARQAVVWVDNTFRLARHIWTSDSDDEQLAHGVLIALTELFTQRDAIAGDRRPAAAGGPSSIFSLRIHASETALLNVARRQASGLKLVGYVQSKKIDAQAARATLQATPFSFRSFANDAEYQEWIHDMATYDAHLFVRLGMASDVQEEYKTQRERTTKTLPLGMHTPEQYFRCLFDGDGALVGRLWFDVDTAMRTSYCFRFCMEEAFRGKGLGKVLLAVWEQSAAELGASTLILHVHEQNKPAVGLYAKCGFQTESFTFDLVERTVGKGASGA